MTYFVKNFKAVVGIIEVWPSFYVDFEKFSANNAEIKMGISFYANIQTPDRLSSTIIIQS